jgi:hypothetical protein
MTTVRTMDAYTGANASSVGLLDEYPPPRGPDGSVGRQHAHVVQVVQRLGGPPRPAGRIGSRREARDHRLAQHVADVGMGDQVVRAIDHECTAAPPETDLANQLSDEFEVDLGHGDAIVAAAVPDGDRDVGLRAVLEVGVAEMRPIPACGHERGAVLDRPAAGDVVGIHAGNTQLLAPVRIDAAQLRDRRHELQLAPELVQPPAWVQGAPGQVGHLADFHLEVMQVIADARGRCARLGILPQLHLFARLLVVERDLGRAAGDQCDADEEHEDRRVVAKQAALHRVTAFPRPRSPGPPA